MSSFVYYNTAKVKELEAEIEGETKTLKGEEIKESGFPEIELEIGGEDYFPQTLFSYGRDETTLKYSEYSIVYTKFSYAALKAKMFNLEDIWIDGINAPYSGSFQGGYLDDYIDVESFIIKKIDNETGAVINEYRIDSVPGIIRDVKQYEKEHQLDGPGRKTITDFNLLVELAGIDLRFYNLASDELKNDKDLMSIVFCGMDLSAIPDEMLVNIPPNKLLIKDGVLITCFNKNVEEVIIPDNVTRIGDNAFERCKSLTSITIPDSVISIGFHAFEGCISLKSIVIPKSVTSIEFAAFDFGVDSFEEIIVDRDNKIYDSRENCSAIIETETNVLIFGCKNTKIPDGVTSIGDYSFSGCESLTSVVIPACVASIGKYAFSNCTSLTSIVIPDSVTSIGEYAFLGCKSLADIIANDEIKEKVLMQIEGGVDSFKF